MPVHLGASWVQKVSKMRLGVVQTLPRIFRIFLEFILIFLELFLFIRRLYNLFHELQTLYLDSSCPNVSLGIFLEFLWFFEYFWSSKNLFWCLLELFSHWKINSKKGKPILQERAEPEGPTRSGRPGPLRPSLARWGPSATEAVAFTASRGGHKIPRTKPKFTEPKYLVPCSVPSFEEPR
jgi:hypothetical protein